MECKSECLMRTLLLTIAAASLSLNTMAQPAEKRSVVIGSLTDKPNALLIVNPPNSDQGVLMPQLSTNKRTSMEPSSPSEDGLIVFDTNLQTYFYWSNGRWVRLDASNYLKNSFYTIDPGNFQQLRANTNVNYNNIAIFETDNTFVTATRDGVGEEILAPVNLPHGALIKELTLYYFDNDADNLQIRLMRKSLSGNNDVILTWTSSGTATSVRSETFYSFNGMESIDLENYTYRLVVLFDIDAEDVIDEPSQATQRIYGVKIKYQP
jgi:hypothetical protein